MQTFLPIPTRDYSEIARLLDSKRLYKQALEAIQITLVLIKKDKEGNFREPKGWVNHPAVRMWRGHEVELARYTWHMISEATHRGINTKSLLVIFLRVILPYVNLVSTSYTADDILAESTFDVPHKFLTTVTPPVWMKIPEYYAMVAKTHRQALLTKQYEYYSLHGWPEDLGYAPDTYEYLWPVPLEKKELVE